MFRFLLISVIAVCGLASCSHGSSVTVSSAGSTGDVSVPRTVLPDSVRRTFDELYLESVVQGLAGRKGLQFELLQAALHLDPDAPEALADIAELYGGTASAFDKSSQDTVAALFGRAVALDPGNGYYRRMLAAVLYEKGDRAGCIAQLERISGVRRDTQLLLMLARLYSEQNETEKAVAALDEVDRLEGASEQTAMLRFYLYIRRADNEHAYAALENLCAEYPEELSYRVLLGDAYAQMGYHEMALATYEDVLAAEPDNSAAQISLLGYYRRTKQDSLYLEHVADLVLNPKVASSLRTEAMADYVRQAVAGRTDSAEVRQLFRRTLSLPQDDDEMWRLYLSYLVSGPGDVPEDIVTAVALQAIADRPECSPARMHCMGVMVRRRDYEQLVRLAREGREADSTDIFCYYFEVSGLTALGRDADAEPVMKQALSIASSDRFPSPEHTPEEQENALNCASDIAGIYGDLLYEQGQRAEAYAVYEKALSWNPENLAVLNNFAYYLSVSGDDLSRALGMGRQVAEAEPDNPVYLDTYAWALFLDGQYAQARVYIEEALRHDEKSYVYLDHAGDIAYRLGRPAEALKYWRQALKACDDRAERRKINRKITRKRLL